MNKENALELENFNNTNKFISLTSRDSSLSEITNCSSKQWKTDPLWGLLDKIGNKWYCQLCHKEYSIEIGLRDILDMNTKVKYLKWHYNYILSPMVKKMKLEFKLWIV